ncbi:YafY family protein [Janthinobacterium sp. PC23-8]|uniref:helix-turn-helix transcriptional regulator n=1 Tax=Janthinobacterium sp. PC23-8 TaxID=2012679 RepID=UPI000B969EA7|nr:YafY family protein [Janthinobacterium sp. PC23-8]OYO31234.1 transcriptional regulator [Janthinobacterium sp. PC23-8]
MSRSGRLFLLMDAMRAKRVPVTAAQLAQQLGVSERTIYRDIQTLAELGAPLQGEAGVGYLLRRGTFLPPLMFDADELEALVLGARWVRRQGDAALAQAASAALAKIAAACSSDRRDLRDSIAETSLWVPLGRAADADAAADRFVQPVREAIRHECKLTLAYQDEHGSATARTVWPFALAYFEGKRLLAAWCELRGDYRHFRIDRIASVDSGERYPKRRHELLGVWRKMYDIEPES